MSDALSYDLEGQRRKYKKSKFTALDDMKLKELVDPLGNNDWNEIALRMKDRNPRQCRERWEYYLSPTVNNGPWTEEEDRLLNQKYNELGSKWTEIAKFFRFRTNTNVKNRWLLMKRTEEKKSKITARNPIDELFRNVDVADGGIAAADFFSFEQDAFLVFQSSGFLL